MSDTPPGWNILRSMSIAVVLGQAISSCLSTLAAVAKTRYFAKNQLFSLTASEDLYEIWKKLKFEEDMTLCPPVECGHTFCCFVKRPETSAKKQLLQSKSMEVCNYFQIGHVRI